MSEPTRCTTCGAAIPPDAEPPGCPRCLIEIGLEEAIDPDPGEDGEEPVGPEPASIAALFPDLDIVRVVGRGGMGIVYEARQARLDRPVGLKLLAPKFAEDPSFAERFTREARAMARLSHPNIVSVFDFGERDGQFFLIMEFVDGTNLRDALEAGRLAPAQALAIVPRICDALQYAHDNGVVHRDIKPENVLLDKSGHVKIADFGLAKIADAGKESTRLTRAGTVMGTPQYMAPEQIERPQDVDHRADIYSLGVVFYEMLTGELPIGRFAAPSRKVSIDVRLDEVVLKALEKERERRYQQASEVRSEVESLTGHGDGASEPGSELRAGALSERPRRPGSPAEAPTASTGSASGHAGGAGSPTTGSPSASSGDLDLGMPSRLSRLAIAGAICAGASVLLVILQALATQFMPPSVLARPGALSYSQVMPRLLAFVFLVLPMLLMLSGSVLSISAWVSIVRSGGRLRGLWLAISSLGVSLFCVSPVAIPFYMFFFSWSLP